jgi:hypothetical protein
MILSALDTGTHACAREAGHAPVTCVLGVTSSPPLSILEASHIVYTLPQHHANFGKRLVKAPKLHFYDSGLAAASQCPQNSRVARRAPSAIAAILAHTTSGSTAAWPTQVPKPQSLPAMTFSRPTSLA